MFQKSLPLLCPTESSEVFTKEKEGPLGLSLGATVSHRDIPNVA